MKTKFTFLILSSFIFYLGFAQTPQALTYQAIAKFEWGVRLHSKTITLRFTIIQGSESGTPLYIEETSTKTNRHGVINVQIGLGNPTLGNFSNIDWGTSKYYLKIEMDPKGGRDFILKNSPRQLLSVPYALYIKSLSNIPNNLNQITPDAGNRIITNIANPVNSQDAATKTYVDALELRVKSLEQIMTGGGLTIIFDIDGNGYDIVKVGSQLWLKQNLKVTRYRNGDTIPNVTKKWMWSSYTTGAYCNYNFDPSNGTTYGRLYNWYTVVDPRNICPNGFHVPTETEWSILTTYLGGEDIAGGKLKETGTNHWLSPNIGATNEFGFTALPGGRIMRSGDFASGLAGGMWWSSNKFDDYEAWCRNIGNDHRKVIKGHIGKGDGFSIRCLKD